jgi:hypothetical protein
MGCVVGVRSAAVDVRIDVVDGGVDDVERGIDVDNASRTQGALQE